MNLLSALHLPKGPVWCLGLALALAGAGTGPAQPDRRARLVMASGVGFAVALGWVLTFALAQVPLIRYRSKAPPSRDRRPTR